MNVSVCSHELSGSITLPIDGLSNDARAIIDAVTETYQCNRDFVTAAVFSVVGTAIGKRLYVYDGKYSNYLSEWFCIVANSGCNKSSPIRWLLRPLSEKDAASYALYCNELNEWRRLSKNSTMNSTKPVYKQILLSDSTPEARWQVLANNPNGILLSRDEIKGFIDDVGRYNRSGEISQMLSVFDADNITINRKGDGPLLIERPFMGILGGVQPNVLGDTFGSDLFMNNGFNQRWLFVYPDSVPPAMYSDSSIPTEVRQAWDTYINNLLNADFSPINGRLIVSDEAKNVYISYYNSLQNKKADADHYMSSVYSKLQIHVLRWAGITHFLADNSGMSRVLPGEMEYSVRCMSYFERCAEKVYMKLTENRNQPEIRQLTKEQLIAMCYNSCNPKSKQDFANAIGVSRPFVSRAVKKFPTLRCYGYGNGLCVDNKKDNEDLTVTP